MTSWNWVRGRAPRLVRLVAFGAVAIGGAAIVIVIVGPRVVQPVASQPAPPPALPRTVFKPTEMQAKSFTVAPVQLAVIHSETITEGNIALDDDLNTPVFSPYSGRVVRLIAALGAHVERGAPLFAVEASEFVQGANTLITAVAADRTARSQLAQAAVNEKRAHELYLANGGALKDWQQSRTDLAAAQNTARSAGIALAAARNQLQILGKSPAELASLEAQPTQQLDPVSIVTAPIAGTVTQRQVSIGQYIQSVAAGASAPLYTIGDLSKVYLIANVREDDAGAVNVGDPVEVRLPAYPGRLFKAKLSWVAPAVDANTHRLPVRAEIDNPDGALKPMMFANFTIFTGKDASSPVIPQSGIVYEGDSVRVWVARDDGTIESRSVHTGRTQNGMVQILDGVSAGEKVVTRGALFIDRASATD